LLLVLVLISQPINKVHAM